MIVNFAAETHVDRSLLSPGEFIHTDVYGTYVLLDAARRHPNVKRFLHMSTDEVYGDVPEGTRSVETDLLHPRSPYSASKAGAEMQCRAYMETYGVPVVMVRPANNVGPRQHIEKFVPLFTTNALKDQPLPLYGDGKQVRDWLFVEDNCEAIDLLLHEGGPGEVYNIGAKNHRYNIDVAELILEIVGKPRTPDPVRGGPGRARPALPRELRQDPKSWAGRRGTIPRPASRRRCAGTWRTAGGGRRCARASSRSTTRSSTASGWRRPTPYNAGRLAMIDKSRTEARQARHRRVEHSGNENGFLIEMFKDDDKTVVYLSAATPGRVQGLPPAPRAGRPLRLPEGPDAHHPLRPDDSGRQDASGCARSTSWTRASRAACSSRRTWPRAAEHR